MSEMWSHERNLRRRFLAFMVDFLLLSALLMAALYPFSNNLDSSLRVTSNIFHYEFCKDGVAFTRDGRSINRGNWDRVLICDRTTNGLFPSRSATFLNQSENNGTKFNQAVNFQVDGANRLASPVVIDSLVLLILPLLAAIFECSTLQATPGKYLLHLEVATVEGRRPSLVQALIRNMLKLPYAVMLGISDIAVSIYLPSYIERSFLTPDNQMNFPIDIFGTSDYVLLAIPIIFEIASIVILASLFFPWRRAGRAFYDRWAGTIVFRI